MFRCLNVKMLKWRGGFTLVELLVVIAILGIVSGAVYGTHVLSERAFRGGAIATELSQNGRVILERLTREIRQARKMVTPLAPSEAMATSAIMFEDGHVPERYRYIRYFQKINLVKREVIGFYFSGDPAKTLVSWDARPPAGQTLIKRILEPAQIIGEYVASLRFWSPRIINITLTMRKRDKALELRTKVLGRNL